MSCIFESTRLCVISHAENLPHLHAYAINRLQSFQTCHGHSLAKGIQRIPLVPKMWSFLVLKAMLMITMHPVAPTASVLQISNDDLANRQECLKFDCFWPNRLVNCICKPPLGAHAADSRPSTTGTAHDNSGADSGRSKKDIGGCGVLVCEFPMRKVNCNCIGSLGKPSVTGSGLVGGGGGGGGGGGVMLVSR